QFADLIPGLLTSLGILGTFIGLMQGLTSVDFTNAEGTIRSIPQLLSGMKFAFATSVAGIACSLLFNMFNRMAAGRALKALDNFEDAFYELAMPRPLQPDVQLLCQKQDDEARIAHLAENVGSHIAASLEVAIGRAMSPLTQSLDSFIKGATQEQVEGVRRIVGQFVQQLNTSLSGQMTALGETMNIVNQGQLQTQQNLQNTLGIARTMAEDARNMQQASASIAKQMQALCEDMQTLHRQRAQTFGAVENTSTTLSKQIEDLTASLANMQQAVDILTAELDDQQGETQPHQADYLQELDAHY
ncbi:MAG: MotA/TolQ/ExbB proton channel family protein, partial [Clostridia bacterium]